ncbi:MAG: J domain-containing protein [Methylohalobius sp.]
MIRILLILGLLIVLLWSLRWFMRTPPEEVIAKLRGRGGTGLAAALILLALLVHSWLLPVLAIGAVVIRGLPYLLGLLRTWQQRPQAEAGGFGSRRGAMPESVAEAYEILGLKPGASRAEIIAAHRRLVQKVHPDRGGSDFLASQINRAKEILLNFHR